MQNRNHILKEEEFRSSQHKQFQQLLAQRRVQVPRFLQKQQSQSLVQHETLQDAEDFEKSIVFDEKPIVSYEKPIVSDQFDKDSDENSANTEEREVAKEVKSQVETEVHLEPKFQDLAQQEQLQKQQIELEAHIQQEIVHLASIMNKEYGNDEQKFEYQLVRITKKNGEEIEERYEIPVSESETESEAQ